MTELVAHVVRKTFPLVRRELDIFSQHDFMRRFCGALQTLVGLKPVCEREAAIDVAIDDGARLRVDGAFLLVRPFVEADIRDPELTTETPDSTRLSTGIRAIDQYTEGMCGLTSTPESDADAAKGLKPQVPGLLRCKKDKLGLEARLNCMMGVDMYFPDFSVTVAPYL